MEDKIKLFLEYLKKENELRLEWDKEDGIDVDAPDYKPMVITVERVKAFIAYRNIRIQEAWYAKFNAGNNSREVRERLTEYDAERSRRHSIALNSMREFNRFGENYGLPKFYEGEVLDSSDIHDYKKIDVRKAETDFFLQFIDKLSRTPAITMDKYFEELGIEQGGVEEGFLKELRSNIDKTDREYRVEEPLLEDDGDIKFEDDKKWEKEQHGWW